MLVWLSLGMPSFRDPVFMEYNLNSSKALHLGQLASVAWSPYPGMKGRARFTLALFWCVILGRVRQWGPDVGQLSEGCPLEARSTQESTVGWAPALYPMLKSPGHSGAGEKEKEHKEPPCQRLATAKPGSPPQGRHVTVCWKEDGQVRLEIHFLKCV